MTVIMVREVEVAVIFPEEGRKDGNDDHVEVVVVALCKKTTVLFLPFQELLGTSLPGVVAHTCNLSTLGGQDRWIMRSSDQDHPGQHGETPSLLKIQKLAGHGGVCL